jgi:hypothetical protein
MNRAYLLTSGEIIVGADNGDGLLSEVAILRNMPTPDGRLMNAFTPAAYPVTMKLYNVKIEALDKLLEIPSEDMTKLNEGYMAFIAKVNGIELVQKPSIIIP